MSEDDWYRCKEWTEDNKKTFFEKLSRSRSQRDQYVAIQAGTLVKPNPDAALEMVDFYFDTRTNDFHDNIVFVHRAEALLHKGQVDNAIDAYKNAVKREAEFPKALSDASLSLAFLVVKLERAQDYDVALEALEFAVQYDLLLFPDCRFRWHTAHAFIASAMGETDRSKKHAAFALEETTKSHSGFSYHPKVGLVEDTEAQTIERLEAILDH